MDENNVPYMNNALDIKHRQVVLFCCLLQVLIDTESILLLLLLFLKNSRISRKVEKRYI